jgi:hypothetical protein
MGERGPLLADVPVDRRQRMGESAPAAPAVLFWRRPDETIFQSLRSRPEIITR